MTALLMSELRRAFSRRVVWLMLLLAAGGVMIGTVTTFVKSHDAPGLEKQFAGLDAKREAFDKCMGGPDGQFNETPEQFDKCHAQFGDPFNTRDPRFHLISLPNVLKGTTVPWVIIAWLLGASLIGAEWRSGTITTHLTWEPHRVRLMLAKAFAAITVVIAVTIALQALLALTLLPSALLRGTTQGADATTLRTVVAVIGRGTLLAAVFGAIGFSIASIGRNTAAALGIGFLYIAVLDGGIIGSNFESLRRWLLVGNSIILVGGEPSSDIPGRGVADAALLMSAYAAGAIALATAVFRRRDVT